MGKNYVIYTLDVITTRTHIWGKNFVVYLWWGTPVIYQRIDHEFHEPLPETYS